MYTITATAPTIYQSNAVRYFGLGARKNPDGSITGKREFESREDAKKHLIGILTEKHEGGEDDPEFIGALHDIENLGQLFYDGITAYIEEVNILIMEGKEIKEENQSL